MQGSSGISFWWVPLGGNGGSFHRSTPPRTRFSITVSLADAVPRHGCLSNSRNSTSTSPTKLMLSTMPGHFAQYPKAGEDEDLLLSEWRCPMFPKKRTIFRGKPGASLASAYSSFFRVANGSCRKQPVAMQHWNTVPRPQAGWTRKSLSPAVLHKTLSP